MALHKVSSKGQVTLPADCRRALHIQPHDRVSIELENEEVVIRPVPKLNELEGFLGPRLSDEEEEEGRLKAVSRRVEGGK